MDWDACKTVETLAKVMEGLMNETVDANRQSRALTRELEELRKTTEFHREEHAKAIKMIDRFQEQAKAEGGEHV